MSSKIIEITLLYQQKAKMYTQVPRLKEEFQQNAISIIKINLTTCVYKNKDISTSVFDFWGMDLINRNIKNTLQVQCCADWIHVDHTTRVHHICNYWCRWLLFTSIFLTWLMANGWMRPATSCLVLGIICILSPVHIASFCLARNV